FTYSDMYDAHDALICIAEGSYVGQSGRRRLTPEHRFKSPQEMRALFADLPEAIDNTLVIAARCAVMAENRKPLLPPAPKSNDEDTRSDAEVVQALAREGLEQRIKHLEKDAKQPYRERLAYELGVIEKMGFSGYFL